jgi:transketolase
MLQRDAFIGEITLSLEKNKDIFFLSADFGAEALDELRQRFPDNFIHCGISEQAMIDVATGLALKGKQVFVYAMAPFLSLRALEQVKCGPGIMGLPIVLISVGIGLGYADSGPTHYSTEDLACMRAIGGSSVYTASDTAVARSLSRHVIEHPHFAYVRLDRHELADLSDQDDVAKGFRLLGNANQANKRLALVSHGKLTHICNEVARRFPDRFVCMDIIRDKPFPTEAAKYLSHNSYGVLVVDEQTPAGSLGSVVFEAMSSINTFLPIRQHCLPDGYVFQNGGRNFLLAQFGLDDEGVLRAASTFESCLTGTV